MASFRSPAALTTGLEAHPDGLDIGYENEHSRQHSIVLRRPTLTLLQQRPADQQPPSVYLSRLAPGSQRTMRQALDTIAALLTGGVADADDIDWSAVRYQHAQAVRRRLAETYAPASANKMLAALRGVLREAWRLGQIGVEDYHRATDLEAVGGDTLPAGRALSTGELAALMRVCSTDGSPAGARDAAMLALLYSGGLRRSEAVALDITDYDAENGAVTIRAAKGRKDRVVYAANGAAAALTDWLTIRGPDDGPLFMPIDKGGTLHRRRMSGQAIMAVVAKRARQAGVPHLSPHDFRRTFVSDLLDRGADIAVVAQLAGHASVTTTQRYDRRDEKAKRKATQLLHVPYQPRGGDR